MLLAVSTAQNKRELAILEPEGDSWTLLKEEIWLGKRDDVEQLVPRLEALLEELGLTKEDLTGIVVVHGPGPFTSLRTGVVFANTLADGLKIPLYKIHTFELMWRSVAGLDPLITLVNAGGMDVALQVYEGEHEDEYPIEDPSPKLGQLSILLAPHTHDKYKVISIGLKEALRDQLYSICLEKKWEQVQGHEVLTLAEVIQTYGLNGLAQAKPMGEHGIIQVEPYYLPKSVIHLKK